MCMSSVEEQLKALIQKQYKSIREFSIAVDMPYSTLDSIFKRGVDKASIVNIVKICRELGISADAIAEGHIVEARDAESPPLTHDETRIGRAYGRATPPVQETVEVALKPFMPAQEKALPASDEAESAKYDASLESIDSLRVTVKPEYLQEFDALPTELQERFLREAIDAKLAARRARLAAQNHQEQN